MRIKGLSKGARGQMKSRLTSRTALMLGAGAATTVAGVVWRMVSGGESEGSPEQIASLTAQAVANAAREMVIEGFDGEPSTMVSRLQQAAEHAVRDAAAAGADVTAAVIGALEGAVIAARQAEASQTEVLLEVESRVLLVVSEIGEPAVQRVRQVLDGRRW